MTIDWSKAPDWALGHGMIARDGIKQIWFGEKAYMILGDNRSYVYGGGVCDTRHNYTRGEIQYQQLRPGPWTGEGLPPVGTVCEQQTWVNHLWRQVTVVAHFNDFAVCAWEESPGDSQVELAPPGDLRPIRTPEQIAAEERETELNRMVATVSMLDKGWARKVCAGLYDAGYRKQAQS